MTTRHHERGGTTRHKLRGGVPLLPPPFHLSLPCPVGRHCRAVFAPAAAPADRASGTHLVCSLRNSHDNGDSWSANPRLDDSGKGSAIRDSSPRRRTQTKKIRRRLRKITSLVARFETSFSYAPLLNTSPRLTRTVAVRAQLRYAPPRKSSTAEEEQGGFRWPRFTAESLQNALPHRLWRRPRCWKSSDNKLPTIQSPMQRRKSA